MRNLIEQELTMSRRADKLIDELARCGQKLAEAEFSYRRAKTQIALRMKAEGESATMIMQILKGHPEVAQLALERDIAKAKYETARESINLLKWQMRITENQIQREWGRNEQI